MDYGDLPSVFAPLQEKTFNISVSVEGPPSIDATYTFEWDNGSYPYRVTGERLVVLAFGVFGLVTTPSLGSALWNGVVCHF